MKKKFIESSLKIIMTKKQLSVIEEKKFRYGLEAFYNLITKMIVLLVLAISLNVIKEFILLALVYSSLRLYGFGLHAKKSWQCWLTTIPIYIGGCLFIKYCVIPNYIFIGLWILSFISFALFAPADTPARPLIHKNKRIRAKVLSLIILLIYLFFTLHFENHILTNSIIVGLLIETVMINPLVYKLLNIKFNNYKTYKMNVV